MLLYCFTGLNETTFPLEHVALNLILLLLDAEGASAKVKPMLDKLMLKLRDMLMYEDKTLATFKKAVKVLKRMSDLMLHELDPFLKLVVPPLNTRAFDRRVQQELN